MNTTTVTVPQHPSNYPMYFSDGAFRHYKVTSPDTGIFVSTIPGRKIAEEMSEPDVKAVFDKYRADYLMPIQKKNFEEAVHTVFFMLHSIVVTGKKAVIL